MGSRDDKRKRKGPDFTIDNTIGGPLEDKPMVIKISSPQGTTHGTNRSSAMNRRAFLKGTLTAGAGLVGIAGTVGSSGSDEEKNFGTDPAPPDNNNNNNNNDSNNGNTNSPGYESQCSNTYHPSHAGIIPAVDFDNTGRLVVSAGQDDEKATAKVWDTETGDLLLTYRKHTGTYCGCAAFSPDGTRIATAAPKDRLHVWDAATGDLIMTFLFPYNSSGDLAFSPDGTKIAAFGAEAGDRIFEIQSGTLLTTHSGHTAYALCGAYSPDGTQVVSSDMDNPLRLWDAATGDLIRTYDGHSGEVLSVAFSPDGTQIASCGPGSDGVHIWERDTGNLVTQYMGHGNTNTLIRSIAFHPNGLTLATGDLGGNVDIWNCASAERLVRYSGHKAYVDDLAYSPDGTRIVSGSNDKNVHIWSTAEGTMETRLADETLETITETGSCNSGSGCTTNTSCTCNTVCTCDTVCTCNAVCSCDSYSGGGGGGHYWFPN